jgi:predicted YcjX-like family ATPase
VRLSELTDSTADAFKNASAFLSGFRTPTIRLGVTGLARSGKTVFITALVRSLIAGGRLPFFAAMAEGRIERAYLVPQPDDTLPRFAYEEHLGELAKDPPQWPESTRRLSQLRLTIEYNSALTLRRALGPGRLNLDIVDYPGEWLTDLPLLERSFADWSRQAVADARDRRRAAGAADWLSFMSSLDPDGPADEQLALRGADTFTRYLANASSCHVAPPASGPGRFRLPGDLAGSPLLTFFPLPPAASGGYQRASLGAMLARRFESYKSYVVKPFFRDHFTRLDRQIVLIDVLSSINAGRDALIDLENSMTAILACFRPGANTWLSSILARRIDRLLFAATKADHLHHTNHDRLEAILRLLADKAIARAALARAEVKVMALAALRATREAEARQGWQRLPCVVGVPLPGERLGRKLFDGRTEAAIFPGDLPQEPASLFAPACPQGTEEDLRFVKFRPPRINLKAPTGEAPPLPHVRLDRAIEFLLGDRLA